MKRAHTPLKYANSPDKTIDAPARFGQEPGLISRLSAALTGLRPRGTFARGVGTLIGGTAGSQLLTMLAAPVVMRLFSPTDFGMLAVYAGLLGIVTVVASLCYELAIPLPDTHQEAANIAVLALVIVVAISALSLLIVAWAGGPITHMLGVPKLARYFWLLPIGIIMVGVYQVFNLWALRTKSFSAITGTRLKQSLTSVAIQIGGYSFGPVALLVAHAAGQGMGGLSLGRAALRFSEFRHVSLAGMAATMHRYRHFPIFSTWAGLLNSGGVQMPSLMFAALFGPQAAGLYVLTNRVLSMPLTVVGSAIGTYLFATGAEARRQNRIAPLVADVYGKLANIAMPPAMVFLLAGPNLFAFVFGESWREAGEFARWLSPWLYVAFVTSPLNVLFDVLERQRLELYFEILLFTLRAIAIIFGAWTGDVLLTVGLFSLGGVAARVTTLIWLAIVSGNPITMLIRPTLTAAAWSMACSIPLALALWFRPEGDLWLIGTIATGLLISMRLMHLFHKAE